MKSISLSGKRGSGMQTIVSDKDFDFLCQWKWQLSGNGYVMRCTTRMNSERKTVHATILMHRVVAQRAGFNVSLQIDHKNRNRLDNQRSNLRAATRSQNLANSKLMKTNSTGFRGVDFSSGNGRFRARLRINGTLLHLGYFDTAELAYAAYCKAAKHYHGEFCSV